jgi:S-adenosylmethionine:tRNA ribosyltransferase-isomerase
VKPSDFDFELPPERIAQEPLPRRDASRLLVLDRGRDTLCHERFARLPELLRPGDLVVLNDTRVLPALLPGRKPSGGRVELLLVEPLEAERDGQAWRCLLDAARSPAPGSVLRLDGGLSAEVLERGREDWLVRLRAEEGAVAQRIEEVGRVPLPPYLRRAGPRPQAPDDRERYQTVFARRPGAVAAPTAGLHFTAETLRGLRSRDVETARLTLHVGPGTFLPVRTERIEDHRLRAERFVLPAEVARAVERVRRRGGRVVAVGTTVVRTLEHRAVEGGRVAPGEGRCDLFIVPGYRFRVVDVLLTNFHLPRSTLVMLVSAFAGTARVREAYREALETGYRFYSYGDAMLIE